MVQDPLVVIKYIFEYLDIISKDKASRLNYRSDRDERRTASCYCCKHYVITNPNTYSSFNGIRCKCNLKLRIPDKAYECRKFTLDDDVGFGISFSIFLDKGFSI